MSARAQAPLLTTKLDPPDPGQRIARAALVARLHDAPDARLVLIRAPAGWGKSTLMAQWRQAESGRRMFAWVSLDRSDSDPVRFWNYVIEALHAISPRVGSMSRALVNAPGVDLAREMLPVLVEELSHLPAPVVIALDDYHQIDCDAVHATVRALLDYPPATVSVALATRADPPLPVARLRASGQLVDVDMRRLQFSVQEAAAFLNDQLGLDLTGDEVASLHARTEGWPAGLYLAALSLRERPDRSDFVAEFAGTDRHIVDYLVEEVLLAQEPEVREFMVKTSVLERMCGPLCDAVLETANATAMLDRLARSNLFVLALDAGRGWYRYHQLLRTCLAAELTREGSAATAQLHRRAAGWHLGEGQISDGIRHTIAAGDHDHARELIATHWAPMMMVTAGERSPIGLTPCPTRLSPAICGCASLAPISG